jgi:hypothetical protein
VIDGVTNFVERPKTVAERIERVAEAVDDPARVLPGTDCGFDSAPHSVRVHASRRSGRATRPAQPPAGNSDQGKQVRNRGSSPRRRAVACADGALRQSSNQALLCPLANIT